MIEISLIVITSMLFTLLIAGWAVTRRWWKKNTYWLPDGDKYANFADILCYVVDKKANEYVTADPSYKLTGSNIKYKKHYKKKKLAYIEVTTTSPTCFSGDICKTYHIDADLYGWTRAIVIDDLGVKVKGLIK